MQKEIAALDSSGSDAMGGEGGGGKDTKTSDQVETVELEDDEDEKEEEVTEDDVTVVGVVNNAEEVNIDSELEQLQVQASMRLLVYFWILRVSFTELLTK